MQRLSASCAHRGRQTTYPGDDQQERKLCGGGWTRTVHTRWQIGLLLWPAHRPTQHRHSALSPRKLTRRPHDSRRYFDLFIGGSSKARSIFAATNSDLPVIRRFDSSSPDEQAIRAPANITIVQAAPNVISCFRACRVGAHTKSDNPSTDEHQFIRTQIVSAGLGVRFDHVIPDDRKHTPACDSPGEISTPFRSFLLSVGKNPVWHRLLADDSCAGRCERQQSGVQ